MRSIFTSNIDSRRFYLLIFLLAFLLVYPACKEKCEEYYLGSLVTLNPYNGTETLCFESSENEEILFIGQGRRVRMNTVGPNESGDICESSEWDNTYFDEENGWFDLNIFLRPSTNYGQSFMYIALSDFRYNDDWHYYSGLEFNIPLDRENLKENQYYIDSLKLQNITHYDVFVGDLSLHTSPTTKLVVTDSVHPIKLYYTVEIGIVKVDFDDGSTWEFKEIRKAYN